MTGDTYADFVEVSGLPSLIRGFGDVKVESIRRFRERQVALSATK